MIKKLIIVSTMIIITLIFSGCGKGHTTTLVGQASPITEQYCEPIQVNI